MSGRGAMTMRAAVSRSPAQPADGWGQSGPPSFVSVGTVPCYAWNSSRREIRDDGKTAVVNDLRALVPFGADVEEGDRLVISDRLGSVLFGGPIAVDTITPVGRGNSRERECVLVRHL